MSRDVFAVGLARPGGALQIDMVALANDTLRMMAEGVKPVTRCAWCRRLWDGEKWVNASPPANAPVTDGICEPCADELAGEPIIVVSCRCGCEDREGRYCSTCDTYARRREP